MYQAQSRVISGVSSLSRVGVEHLVSGDEEASFGGVEGRVVELGQSAHGTGDVDDAHSLYRGAGSLL